MKNNNYSTEGESKLDQEDDIYEDYDSIKLKYTRWQRLFGWAIK